MLYIALSQEKEGESAVPVYGKLLWKLTLKEQDSTTEPVWTPANKFRLLPPMATPPGQGLTLPAPHTAQPVAQM